MSVTLAKRTDHPVVIMVPSEWELGWRRMTYGADTSAYERRTDGLECNDPNELRSFFAVAAGTMLYA